MAGWRNYWELWIVAAATAAALALLLFLGLAGWQGSPDSCFQDGQCFCEADRGGLIRTPANTLSNLGFTLVGLGIAFQLGRERSAGRLPRDDNAMTRSPFFAGFYATVAALVGPGSMALHASLMSWGSVLDLLGMFLYISFVFFYGLVRLRGITPVQFVVGYLSLNTLLLLYKIYVGPGSPWFGALAVACVGIELQLRRRGQGVADLRLLAAGVGTFLLAFGIWLPSRNGGPLCDPDSLLQGHGVWHLLCALATLWLYLYARSERASAPASA